MKITTKFLGFIFVLVIQSCLVTQTTFVSMALADENWKNFFVVQIGNDTAADHAKYARQMGYSSIGLLSGGTNLISQYRNNPDLINLKFFLIDPCYYRNPVLAGRSRTIDKLNPPTNPDHIAFYNRNMVWKSNDPFPNNLATGWFTNANTFVVQWDFQQQRVINEVVEKIIELAKTMEDPNTGFTFGGYMVDVPKLSGDFNVWNETGNNSVTLSYWTGADSGLLHGTITHEYATYSEGKTAFFKQLNTRMNEEFPDAKWVLHPWRISNTSAGADEWIQMIKNRPDRDELTPDMIFQEKHGTEFADDNAIFTSGVNITRDRIGISQPNRNEGAKEYENRLYAAKAAINGSWYNYFKRYSNDPNFQRIVDVYPRHKLVRCIPGWDNLNNIPLTERSWNGSVYRSTNSYISSDVMYSRHPKTGKLFAVFNTTNGVIKLNSGEKVGSVRRVNGYFEEAEDGSADVDILGEEIRLKNGVSIAVDSTSGQVKGNGYIFTLSAGGSPKVITGSATDVTSDAAMLNGIVNAGGLSATAWFEYGVTSGSYSSKSSTQTISGSNDTTVNFSISGLSTAVTYYYRLVAQNDAGTSCGSEMSFTTLDTIAPNCSVIINNGDDYTRFTTVTLDLSATDNVGVTGYYISSGSSVPLASAAGWTTVPATASFSGSVSYTLSSGDGKKTIYVWYKDAAGNVSNTASDSITLDVTNPLVAITSPTSDAAYTTANGVINLGGSASDSTSGVSRVTWSSNKGGSGVASGTTNWSVSGITLSVGDNVITVTARDAANNTSVAAITVTYGAAPKTITGSATNMTADTIVLNGTVNAGGLPASAWFEYGLTSGSYGSKSPVQSISGSGDTAVTFHLNGLSAAVTYYYRLVAQNSAGTSYGSEMSFNTPDTTAPNCSVSIDDGAGYSNSSSIVLTLEATDNIGVTGYYLSASPQVPLASASGWITIPSVTTFNATVSYTLSSGDGSKTVYVWYKDAAGNVSNTASDSIILDTTRPSVTITSPTSSGTYKNTGKNINLGGNASDATSNVRRVTWRNNRGGNGVASGTTNWSISGISLSKGENIITVTAMDSANNTRSDTITVTW